MSDHLHLLVQGAAGDPDLRRFVRLFKQRSSFAFKRVAGRELWQRGYFDRVLRADEDTVAVVRYILMNPVRARLCDAPEQYPFMGSFTLDVKALLESVQAALREADLKVRLYVLLSRCQADLKVRLYVLRPGCAGEPEGRLHVRTQCFP